MTRARPWLFACVILLGLALPQSARAQDLDAAIQRLTRAWASGDAGAIVSLAARGGIAIDLEGAAVGPVGSRQAAAVLRRLFDTVETVNLRPGMARVAGGSPPRGFSEIAWTTRVRGTSIPQRTTVFVGYVYEGDQWRINQIRLMR